MGELQKRIKVAFNPPERRDKRVFWDGIADEQKVLLIIDEMIKEFPKIKRTELPLKGDGEVDWEETAKIMELRNIKRLEWYKRWLK